MYVTVCVLQNNTSVGKQRNAILSEYQWLLVVAKEPPKYIIHS